MASAPPEPAVLPLTADSPSERVAEPVTPYAEVDIPTQVPVRPVLRPGFLLPEPEQAPGPPAKRKLDYGEREDHCATLHQEAMLAREAFQHDLQLCFDNLKRLLELHLHGHHDRMIELEGKVFALEARAPDLAFLTSEAAKLRREVKMRRDVEALRRQGPDSEKT